MTNIASQKRMAADILNCGVHRIKIKTIKDVERKLKAAGHNVGETIILDTAAKLGIKEASNELGMRRTTRFAKKQAMREFDELAKGGNVNLMPVSKSQREFLAAELILTGKIKGRPQTIRKELEKRGFLKEEIDGIIDKIS